MKNKKLMWIIIAVILVLIVVLVVTIGLGGSKNVPVDEEKSEPVEESAQPAAGEPENESASAEEPAEESAESAQLIEDEGNLIITIPDDEESDGF